VKNIGIKVDTVVLRFAVVLDITLRVVRLELIRTAFTNKRNQKFTKFMNTFSDAG
jgi:hypothetical protein